MKLYNKDFRNAYLMFGIMAAMFLYMGISLLIVGEKVGNNRSCIVTCDTNIQPQKKKEPQSSLEAAEKPAPGK